MSPGVTKTYVLTQPTVAERRRIWEDTFVHWGSTLTLEEYIGRETYNLKAPLAREGGLTNWILTDDGEKDERPILSSCETYKKRALVASKNGVVEDAIAYGITSVFTPTKHGGKGYAKKLMVLLAQHLKGVSNLSVLWSDIGPKFYHTVGWKPFESTCLRLPALSSPRKNDPNLQPITDREIPALADSDERRLRRQLKKPSPKVKALIIPDSDTLQWHLSRENYMCQKTLGRVPSVRGVLWTSPIDPNSKIWAVWTRKFHGKDPKKNTVHVIRLSVENDIISDIDLKDGMAAIGNFIQTDAKGWECAHMEIWNPEERVKRAALSIEKLRAEFVTRENDLLASMQWHGQEAVDEIDWVCNEGFCWC